MKLTLFRSERHGKHAYTYRELNEMTTSYHSYELTAPFHRQSTRTMTFNVIKFPRQSLLYRWII